MKGKIFKVLDTEVVFYVLSIIFLLSSFSTFWYGRLGTYADQADYWGIAKGMHHGQFSAWYFLPVYTPETLRTWGYPFFLYLTQFIFSSYLFAQLIQFGIYLTTIGLALKIIQKFYHPLAFRSILIFCLIFNNHLAFYSGVLIAENLTIFFIVLFVYVYIIYKDTYWKYVALALISFAVYQLRAVFLLFPFLLFIYFLIWRKSLLRKGLVYILLFSLTLLPFGLWNKSVHGVFKVTPLEGGMGVMHEGGYWDYRLPEGFTASYYYGIEVNNDILRPSFLTQREKQQDALEYNNYWQLTENNLYKNYRTPEDEIREKYMTDSISHVLGLFKTYSANYTLAREKLLKQDLLKQVEDHPGFYIETRIFGLFRQWVTGINSDQLHKANSITAYGKVLYPFLVTSVFILGGVLLLLTKLLQHKISFKNFHIFFLFIGYCGVTNLPFAAMAKYTVPVHLLILILISITAGKRFAESNS